MSAESIRLIVHKTLKADLPKIVDSTHDELHFTEDGGIYLSKLDGTLVQVGIDNALREKIEGLENGTSIDLTDYYTKEEIDELLKNVDVDVNFHQSAPTSE